MIRIRVGKRIGKGIHRCGHALGCHSKDGSITIRPALERRTVKIAVRCLEQSGIESIAICASSKIVEDCKTVSRRQPEDRSRPRGATLTGRAIEIAVRSPNELRWMYRCETRIEGVKDLNRWL